MKISELNEYLNTFRKSRTSAKGVGCNEEIVVRTNSEFDCEAKNIVETHYNRVKQAIEVRGAFIPYVRTSSNVVEVLDEEGEATGHYKMHTRLQFGEPGMCITAEQSEHLQYMGWTVS